MLKNAYFSELLFLWHWSVGVIVVTDAKSQTLYMLLEDNPWEWKTIAFGTSSEVFLLWWDISL